MQEQATGYFRRVATLLDQTEATDAEGREVAFDEAADDVARDFVEAARTGRRVVLVGNGGSASIAGHMELDLATRLRARALVFNDPPVLTALANDHGYDSAFERMVSVWAEEGDRIVAISSSGRSANIHRAIAAARDAGARVVTMSGFDAANPLRSLGDVNFYVASSHYGEVEVAHHALGHFLTDRASGLAEQGARA